MKILYVTTIGSTMGFFGSIIRELLDQGNVVDIATNELGAPVQSYFKKWGCQVYHISTSRSPFSVGNIKAIKEIRSLANNYDIVHCHTPLASMAARIGCKKLRNTKNLKVIYTAHGFHFFKGAPLKNWLLYYPLEKICSKWTDALLTINHEDYGLALKKMRAIKTVYIPGVGIDINHFSSISIDKAKKKREIGLPEDAYVILSVGELNENKNHKIVIQALSKLRQKGCFYVIAGAGGKKNELGCLAQKLGVSLLLLGLRDDVAELYKMADLYVLPSLREGLNVSVMEALASGLPVLASRIRGNVDLVPEENLFDPLDVDSLVALINARTWSKAALSNVFDRRFVNLKLLELYNNLFSEDCTEVTASDKPQRLES